MSATLWLQKPAALSKKIQYLLHTILEANVNLLLMANACHNGLGEMATFLSVFSKKGDSLPNSDWWHWLYFD
jgi:hypothetical protein